MSRPDSIVFQLVVGPRLRAASAQLAVALAEAAHPRPASARPRSAVLGRQPAWSAFRLCLALQPSDLMKAAECGVDLRTADSDRRLRLTTVTHDCRLPTADCTIVGPVPVHLVKHPLVHDALATLREASTTPETFRHMAVRISLLLAAEATRDMPSQPSASRRRSGPPMGAGSRDGVVVVPVLRAGLGMLDAVLELIPTARVGHIGLQRDEMTAVASQYYSKLPPDMSGSFVLMIDPMLATGGSAVAALDLIRRAGGRDVRMICIVAAPEGIALVERASSRRPHLHAGHRRGSQRAQVHRARPGRFRGSAVRNRRPS